MDVNAEISKLVDCWCERRELGALETVLGDWLGNNGLTDGWCQLRDALKHAYTECSLPQEEREMLKSIYIEIDVAVRNR